MVYSISLCTGWTQALGKDLKWRFSACFVVVVVVAVALGVDVVKNVKIVERESWAIEGKRNQWL